MTTYDLGAPVTSTWKGAPTNGTYAVALTRPDGTDFSAPAFQSSPPASIEFTPDMAGRWLIRWTSTAPAGAWSDVADVWPEDPKFIIGLDDARLALGMGAVLDPASLDDLRLYVAAATPVIEDIVGPVVEREVVQVLDGGAAYVLLDDTPASIVSVVENGNTITDYQLGAGGGGILYAGSQTYARNFLAGRGMVTVTYKVGAPVVPQNVRLATRELVRHWWQIGKQGLRSSNGNMPVTADAWTPSGFAVPRRVIELCAASAQPGGFA